MCSLCKYRTFYEDEMGSHLDSKFHKEHFKYVGTKLPKQTADFLQEYVTNKTKKTEELRKTVEDLDGLIQQIYRDQDLTQEIAMEHFVKKVEAAHCAACDLFIPMQFGIIQKHLKTMDHNRNRRLMMEQSKKSSLMVARSILNNKLISKKLERYLKGENPFTDNPEEEKEQDEVEIKRKKYNSVSSSSSFQGTDVRGGVAPRSNGELGAAQTGAPGSVTGKGPPWRGLGLRDTAPALQSITKHNHMAGAGKGCFDSEQRIQGCRGGAFQTWTEAQRAGRPRR